MTAYLYAIESPLYGPNDPLSLHREAGSVRRVVLDTDAGNEVDDQFAIAYAMRCPDRLSVEAIHAAPFSKVHGVGPAEGVAQSHEEIERVLEKLGGDVSAPVALGAERFMQADDAPVESPAARNLIELAMSDGAGPLFVVGIGAATNIASALLIEPAIRERIVVVWLGGHPHDWPTAREYNLMQDVHAARTLFDAGVPLVHIPCKNVAEKLIVTHPELNQHVRPRGAIGEYLCEISLAHSPESPGRSKVIWDIANIAWLIEPAWAPTAATPSPYLTDQMQWQRRHEAPMIRVAMDIDRDRVLEDLYRRL